MKNYSQKVAVATLFLSIFLFAAFRFINHKKINIVFIGDSITQGQDNPALQPSVYAVKYLKNKLGTDSIVQANRGISGKTTLDYLPAEILFKQVIASADNFYVDTNAQLAFSIMLGTNDSAMKGTHGAPVSVIDYRKNLTLIIDSLLKRYPNSKVVINHPIWYSPNTQNGAMYLAEGLARLQKYFPEIDDMVKSYGLTHPGHVFKGDTEGFKYFKKNYANALQHEQGVQGIFYLHPNDAGAAQLGELWAKAIYKALDN
jgi:lysophospholipase L1-like esterase